MKALTGETNIINNGIDGNERSIATHFKILMKTKWSILGKKLVNFTLNRLVIKWLWKSQSA